MSDSSKKNIWPLIKPDITILNEDGYVAVATLDNKKLDFSDVKNVLIQGPLITENVGIEKLVINTVTNPYIRYLVLVDSEVMGHKPAHTINALVENGIDEDTKRIIGAEGAIPNIPNINDDIIAHFREQIEIVNLVKDYNPDLQVLSDDIYLETIKEQIANLPKKDSFTTYEHKIDLPLLGTPMKEMKPRISDNIANSMIYPTASHPFNELRGGTDISSWNRKISNIGGTLLGGYPGQFPIFMGGSIFYKGHDILKDSKKGIFDEKRAEELILCQDALSSKYNIPCFIDLVADTKEAAEKYILFFTEISDSPFAIDSGVSDVRIHAAQFAEEIGLGNRLIYNSLNMGIDEKEASYLQNNPPQNAIVLAYSSEYGLSKKEDVLYSRGLVTHDEILKMNRKELTKLARTSTLSFAEAIGIPNILIDTAAVSGMDGLIALEKFNDYGYPLGCGAHNVIQDPKNSYASVSINAISRIKGADFLLYGPIDSSKENFSSMNQIEKVMGDYNTKSFNIIPATKHPFWGEEDKDESCRPGICTRPCRKTNIVP
ncbi:MAG: hypothetical protein K0B02_05065 [DPANN group archaeon]|nr:hypothetical protein [DPANN group archaeon]